MKVRNLYIGEIRMITAIEHINISRTKYTSWLERKTLLERIKDNSNKVEDILYGGIYEIKNYSECEVSEEYATNLHQAPLISILDGYNKENISKRKLLQLFKKNCGSN